MPRRCTNLPTGAGSSNSRARYLENLLDDSSCRIPGARDLRRWHCLAPTRNERRRSGDWNCLERRSQCAHPVASALRAADSQKVATGGSRSGPAVRCSSRGPTNWTDCVRQKETSRSSCERENEKRRRPDSYAPLRCDSGWRTKASQRGDSCWKRLDSWSAWVWHECR